MSAEAAFEQLLHFVSRARQVNAVIASRIPSDDEPEYIFQRLNMTDPVAADFRQVVEESLGGLGEPVLRPYDPMYKPDPHEILYLDLETNPDLRQIVSAVSDLDELEVFSGDEEILRNLKFYSITVGGAARKALFFRVYGPKKELSRSKSIAVLFRQGTFDRIREKIFLFDRDIDCFAWAGFMFVVHPSNFHRMFLYFEQLRTQAGATLDRVLQRVPVANAEEFREAVKGQPQMLAKVTSIAKQPYLDQVTMDDVERTIQEFGLEVEVQGQGPDRALVFERHPKNRWLILRLLDDDFLGSVMTPSKYEVSSKLRLK